MKRKTDLGVRQKLNISLVRTKIAMSHFQPKGITYVGILIVASLVENSKILANYSVTLLFYVCVPLSNFYLNIQHQQIINLTSNIK